jgi:hypothetical protein
MGWVGTLGHAQGLVQLGRSWHVASARPLLTLTTDSGDCPWPLSGVPAEDSGKARGRLSVRVATFDPKREAGPHTVGLAPTAEPSRSEDSLRATTCSLRFALNSTTAS